MLPQSCERKKHPGLCFLLFSEKKAGTFGTLRQAESRFYEKRLKILEGLTNYCSRVASGGVEAQTVTDANGRFAFELQRGGYTLRAAWTDAEGRPAAREFSVEAPAEQLDLAL